MLKTTDQLLGMSVVGAGGRVFGRVEELEVETTNLQVVSIIVRITSAAVTALGISKPFWSHAKITIPGQDVHAVTDVIILDLTIDQLAERLGSATATD